MTHGNAAFGEHRVVVDCEHAVGCHVVRVKKGSKRSDPSVYPLVW